MTKAEELLKQIEEEARASKMFSSVEKIDTDPKFGWKGEIIHIISKRKGDDLHGNQLDEFEIGINSDSDKVIAHHVPSGMDTEIEDIEVFREYTGSDLKENLEVNEDAPSKGFAKAVEDYRKLLLDKQDILNKFKEATDPAEKEKLKKEYVNLDKAVKAAEVKFNTALRTEPASLDESNFKMPTYTEFVLEKFQSYKESSETDEKIDLNQISDIMFEGIDEKNKSEFSDAYISAAKINGRDLTEKELEEVNEDKDFVHTKLLDYLN